MADPHDTTVRRVFDEQAGFWDSQYAPGGAMTTRIAQFLGAVQKNIPDGGRVLDFGCGSGDITLAIANAGFDVVGCDVSAAMLDKARAAAAGTARFVRLPGDVSVDAVGAGFDAVVASSVLEYVASPQACLARLGSVVRPGGWIFLTVPDMRDATRRRESWYRLVVGLPGAMTVLGMTRYRAFAQYLRISTNRLKPAQWEAMLASAGWQAEPAPPCDGPLVLLSARKRDA